MSERGDDYFVLGRGVRRARVSDAFEPISHAEWSAMQPPLSASAHVPPRTPRSKLLYPYGTIRGVGRMLDELAGVIFEIRYGTQPEKRRATD